MVSLLPPNKRRDKNSKKGVCSMGSGTGARISCFSMEMEECITMAYYTCSYESLIVNYTRYTETLQNKKWATGPQINAFSCLQLEAHINLFQKIPLKVE